MKQVLFLLLFACNGLGQGTVRFLNTSSTLISGIDGFPTAPAGAYYFGLLTAPVGTSDPLAFTFTGCYATNLSQAGFILGSAIVPGWPAGTAKAFMVCGWPASSGHDWNPAWLNWGAPLGRSMIATGIAGGIEPTSGQMFPPLPLFGSQTISNGFMIWNCLGPYWEGFIMQPTNQTVVVGGTAVFCVGALACPAPWYQWYFNGNPIAGANNGVYLITNVQPVHAGNYNAVLSNPHWPLCCGTNHTSASASLRVVAPSVITSQPQSQTAELGSEARFSVRVTGDPPLTYRWLYNGATPVQEVTTNSLLLLTNVQFSQSGAYTVVISNTVQAVTSSPALFNVIPIVERRAVPGLLVSGQTGKRLVLDSAATMASAPLWEPLASMDMTAASEWYFDITSPPPEKRFYRAWQNAPSAAPVLELQKVPAITLTGPIGGSVRLDYINQFGPTEAWVVLGTVTRTNTSQLYFDTSAVGQPPRLYRVVP